MKRKKKAATKTKQKAVGNTTSRALLDTWRGILYGLTDYGVTPEEAIGILKTYIAAKGQNQP